MNAISLLCRLIAPACLLLLAACQTTTPVSTADPAPQPTTAMSHEQQTAPAQTAEPDAAATADQGVPVAVLLADTVAHEGWVSVALNEGSMLYLNPEPIVTRNDLTGVQSGSSSGGEGLLALELNDETAQRITQITTDNPNGRLALIVGRTLMAAPGYAEPVTMQQLVFAVGTEQNATAAARAIAGVATQDDVPSTLPQAQPPRTQPVQ